MTLHRFQSLVFWINYFVNIPQCDCLKSSSITKLALNLPLIPLICQTVTIFFNAFRLNTWAKNVVCLPLIVVDNFLFSLANFGHSFLTVLAVHHCPIIRVRNHISGVSKLFMNLSKADSNNMLHDLLVGIFCCISSDAYYIITKKHTKEKHIFSEMQKHNQVMTI